MSEEHPIYRTANSETAINPRALLRSDDPAYQVYAKWINKQKTLEEQKKINAGVGGRVARSVAAPELPHNCHTLR